MMIEVVVEGGGDVVAIPLVHPVPVVVSVIDSRVFASLLVIVILVGVSVIDERVVASPAAVVVVDAVLVVVVDRDDIQSRREIPMIQGGGQQGGTASDDD